MGQEYAVACFLCNEPIAFACSVEKFECSAAKASPLPAKYAGLNEGAVEHLCFNLNLFQHRLICQNA